MNVVVTARVCVDVLLSCADKCGYWSCLSRLCGYAGVGVCMHTCLFRLQEIELKDFTQHITPRPSVTSPASASGYNFTPFTDHTHKRGCDQTEHTTLSPPNFDFTSMSLNSSVKSPQSNGTSGSGGAGAVKRRGRRYSDRFGNVRELRSLPYTSSGRQLWSGEGVNSEQSENVVDEASSKKNERLRGKNSMGSLTDSSNSSREGRSESVTGN